MHSGRATGKFHSVTFTCFIGGLPEGGQRQ